MNKRTNKWMVFEASSTCSFAFLKLRRLFALSPMRLYDVCGILKVPVSVGRVFFIPKFRPPKRRVLQVFIFLCRKKKCQNPWTGRVLRTFIFEIQMMQKKKFYLFKKKENNVIKPLYQSLNVSAIPGLKFYMHV